MKKFISSFVITLIFFSHISIAQNVGIGTSTPTQKLDVNGTIKTAILILPQGCVRIAG